MVFMPDHRLSSTVPFRTKQQSQAKMPSYQTLLPRIHILPGALAGSPGHVAEQFSTPVAAMEVTLNHLQLLPDPLIQRWPAEPRGHIVLNAERHGYVPGANTFRGRTLQDVAWLKLALYPNRRLEYLTPVGALLVRLLGWGESQAVGIDGQRWDQFCMGAQSCFRAGYGISLEAQTDVEAYLAEGLAHYLLDRHSLNRHDPRLEKLLAATVFDPGFYSQRS